jgi:inhibitor of KinA sporulation pathway (predicted exonuclease)
MTILRDHILVIDIEATCWKKTPPPGEKMEIIEIGAVLLDVATATPHRKHSILVKPTQSTVSRFCTRLTTLTQTQVDEGGTTLAAGCAELEDEFQASQRLWMSWGDFDHRMFNEQCASSGIAYPFSDRYANIKYLFAGMMLNGRAVGMARALKLFDIPLHGTHHRGADDAWNIAQLLGRMIHEHGRDWINPLWR